MLLKVYLNYRNNEQPYPLTYETTNPTRLGDGIAKAAREAGLAVERPTADTIDVYSKGNCSIACMRTLVEHTASGLQHQIGDENLMNIQRRNREFHADIAG